MTPSDIEVVLGRIELRLTNLEATFVNQRKQFAAIRRDVEHIKVELEAIRGGEYCILSQQQDQVGRAVPNFVTTMIELKDEIKAALLSIEAQIHLLNDRDQ